MRIRTAFLFFISVLTLGVSPQETTPQTPPRKPVKNQKPLKTFSPFERQKAKRSPWSFGGGVAYGYWSQGQREVEGSTGDIYEMSTFTSLNPAITAFAEYRTAEQYSVRGTLGYRTTHFSGDSTIQGLGQGGKVVLAHKLITAGLIAQYFSKTYRRLSFGLGLEIERGVGIDLSVAGTPVETKPSDNPFFIVTTFHVAWIYEINSRWRLAPEVKIGSILNTKPSIFILEPAVNGIYRF